MSAGRSAKAFALPAGRSAEALGRSAESIALRADQVRLGLWMFLGTVTMLFAAFASAYIVRRSGSDWRPVALPSILWLNTAVLAMSSAALEGAHAAGTRRRWTVAILAAGLALLLGVAFLGGQIVAWADMRAAGVYLPTNPRSSFFFMLTGAHAAHVIAALVVLAVGFGRTVRARRDATDWALQFEICRTFWHFLGGVWIFLFVLLTVY